MSEAVSDQFILAVDQGTTSSRSVLYDLHGNERCVARRPLQVSFPRDGWVEQDAREIWATQIETIREVARPGTVAIGITNQRETTICWDRRTLEPLGPAIVWQCRRTARECAELRERGLANLVRSRTGLVIDPYFSASKIRWLIESVPGVRERILTGDARFGTVDSWILTKLTGGRVFATEPSNASRTMLFDIHTLDWDDELLALFGVRRENLPQVLPSAGHFGVAAIDGREIPITATLGDQQASLFGHGCEQVGEAKCTFGTGAFLLMNAGGEALQSTSGLLTSVAWQHGGTTTYALEGSVFVAGSLIQWLRDKLHLFREPSESEALALSVPDSGGVVLVPAFVGLGAPHWDDSARGTIFGITRDTSPGHLVRAALEAVCHQVADLISCPEFAQLRQLSIDGGMAANKFFAQTLANLTARPIAIAHSTETTAFGVARLAGIGAGLQLGDRFTFAGSDDSHAVYFPRDVDLEAQRARWRKGIERTLGWAR